MPPDSDPQKAPPAAPRQAQPSREALVLHLVSDATGETLGAIAKAALALYENVQAREHVHALVRNRRALDRALLEIEARPGIVLYSVVSPELRIHLERRCSDLGLPHLAPLDPASAFFGSILGAPTQAARPGRQHELDARYFRRIEAMNFALAHDDGQSVETLGEADVVLVGISRTSKTPTCLYLANRGVRAGNVPLVPGVPPPALLMEDGAPKVVGLIASPERVVQVRRNRLLEMHETPDSAYADAETVREELVNARRLFQQMGWPVIDVTRRSIEETAAAVLNLLSGSTAGSVEEPV